MRDVALRKWENVVAGQVQVDEREQVRIPIKPHHSYSILRLLERALEVVGEVVGVIAVNLVVEENERYIANDDSILLRSLHSGGMLGLDSRARYVGCKSLSKGVPATYDWSAGEFRDINRCG